VEAALIDTDTLSEISRAHPRILARANQYLEEHGRLTVSAVTIFERLRGYKAAIRAGKPFKPQLLRFQAFALTCRVLAFDHAVADEAAIIWSEMGARARGSLGDILIAATASAYQIPLVTRNHRDFAVMAKVPSIKLTLLDWSR
jgi:predicted nucleic acid-binding protein